MKVVNIGTHKVKNMWTAYVKKLLYENSTYYKRYIGSGTCRYYNLSIRYKTEKKVVEVINYNQFRKIVDMLFDSAKNHIIQGESFNLPFMGMIYVKRIQRDFRAKNRCVDWGRSVAKNPELDEKGNRIFKKLFYFTGDDYLRVAWSKAQVTNQSFYEFKPAKGDQKRQAGFNFELGQANARNKFLKMQYVFCPLRDIIKQEVV